MYINRKKGDAIITDITKKCDGREKMDVTKFFTLLCGFLLIICLTLSITCLVVMRNAVAETSVWQGRAEVLVDKLGGCVEAIKDIEIEEDIPVSAPNASDPENIKARYCLRLVGDAIGVYDENGYLIKRESTQASLLPPSERQRLAEGIWVESWGEIETLLQDFE